MAYATLTMENPHTGAMKQAPVGFSWTTLFFGFFPALIRGDWKWCIIQLILAMLTFGLSWFVFIFIYNKLYVKELISSGYKVKSVINGDVDFISSKLAIKLPMMEAENA